MTKSNFRDQQIQTVLVCMGISVGKPGIDGDAGPETNKAIRLGSSKIYLEMAGKISTSQAISTVTQGEIGTQANMEKVLLDKLKDPKFRQEALDRLNKIDPPTKDSIVATKVILEASGHKVGRDPVTGMVDGKMNDATRVALANTENGRPTAQFMADTVAQASGLRAEQVAGLFPNAPQVGASFATASSGASNIAAVRGLQVEQPRPILEARTPS